ncbi:MAG: FHA domain-containing protein [Anaerolineae bacterium]
MSETEYPHLVDPLGHRVTLCDEVALLGRAPDCDVVIPDPRASRRHVELRRDEEGVTLHDLNSTNGSRLNGQLVEAPTRLRDGDVIEIAGAHFTFRDPDATLNQARFPTLVVDEASGEVWADRRPVSLSPKQYALLSLLWSRRGAVCSKDEIVPVVWPECAGAVYDYQIESLVKRVRAKIEPDPSHPTLLLTVRGRGYKLAVSSV